jgi:NAD(P)-dependent dehydrogenase (short-subunit alcohol dehydrogenase family)
MMRLENKVALITGAGSGIGRETALLFAREGARIVGVDVNDSGGEAAAAEIRAAGGEAVYVHADISKSAEAAKMIQAAEESFGRLDVLFNNAGVNLPGVALEDVTYEQWMQVLDVNLTGMFLCIQAAFRLMKEQEPRGGRIINNGSISAHVPRPDSAPYTATKHAVSGLTRSAALDGRKYDIACSQIDIGNAHTELAARMANGVPQANGTVAVEPLMDVEHVGNAILYMANMPLDANILFLTIMATKMPFVGRG